MHCVANTRAGECQRDELYRLVKYLARPTIAGRRVTECDDGRFRVELKTPWQDGTKFVLLTLVLANGPAAGRDAEAGSAVPAVLLGLWAERQVAIQGRAGR